jgi:large subunit ribosomal protein L28
MCQICGKKTTFGNSLARRGRAKYLGGVGIKTTGITRRKFIPNLQKIRVQTGNGTVKRMTVCTQCIRSNKVQKRQPRSRPSSDAK